MFTLVIIPSNSFTFNSPKNSVKPHHRNQLLNLLSEKLTL